MVAGSLSAHGLGYLALSSATHTAGASDPDQGAERVSRAAHDAVTQTPLLIGLMVAFVLAALVRRTWTASRGKGEREVAPFWFFLLPPLALIVQEAAERLAHAESFPFNPVHEPAFLAALVLQLPFGFAAFLIARVLLRVADALGRALFERQDVPTAREVGARLLLRSISHRRSADLRACHSSRSPPALVIPI
jgi:hypothetical protein